MRGRKRIDEYRNSVFKCLIDHRDTWLYVNKIGKLTGIPSSTVSNILDEFVKKRMIEEYKTTHELKGGVRVRLVRLSNLTHDEANRMSKTEKILNKVRNW